MARLNPLRVSGLDSAASPAAFGAGRSLESFGGGAGPVGYGAGLRIPTADAVGYGAGAARDLAALGNVGLNAADAALRVQRQDAVLSGRRKELAARSEFQKVYMERQAAAPADAKDFTKSTMEAFDQFKNGQLDGLTGVERDIVEKSLLKFQNSVYSDAVGFETKRKFEARKNDVQSMVDIASNAVFSRPADLIDVRNGVLSTIAESDLPDFAKQELAATATAALAKPYFLAQVQRDPYAAREVLTKGDPGALQGLEFGDRAQLLNAADTEIRGLEAEKKAAAREAAAEAKRQAYEAKQLQILRLGQLKDETQFATQMIAQGLPVAGLGSLTKRIAAEGEAGSGLGQALEAAQSTADFGRVFALTPIDDQIKAVNLLQAAPQTEQSYAALTVAGKILQGNLAAQKEGRALERANELGVVRLAPVDITNPDSIKARFDAARLASQHLGTPLEVLTPDERAGIAADIAKLPGEERANYYAKMQAAAGDAYPALVADLSQKGGIPRNDQVIAALAGRPSAAPVANAVGEAMAADPKDLKVNLERTGSSESDLNKAVLRRLESWAESLGNTYKQGGDGAAAFQSDIVDTVKKTAMVLMRSTDFNSAVDQAASSIINDRYEFRDGYRIPKPERDADAYVANVRRLVKETMNSLTPDILDPPGSADGVDEATRRTNYARAVQSAGQFVTLPDESGLLLTDELGNAVTAKGRPVIIKFPAAR